MARVDRLAAAVLAAASVAAAWLLPRPVAQGPGVAVAFAWGCLLLYVPSRIAAWWVWRQVELAAPRVEDRRALGLVLVLGFGLLVWGIDWGLIGHSWAADELRPDWVRDALRHGWTGGWHDKYPWMHYASLAIPLSGFELAERLGVLAPGGAGSWAAQLLLMRAVSVLMGLGTLIAAYLCGVELVGARRAALAPLALLLTPLFVYYGKTANLDIPSLCWFGFAMVAYVRVLRGGCLRDYVWLGVAAAASVATKDQAYANLALLALAVVAVTARRESAGRQILAAAGAALGASAVFHNLLFNFPGFVAHVRLLSTLGDLAVVPRTAAGYARLAGMTLALFRWSFGWPFFALAAFGVAGAVARAERRWWLWLLVVPVSFFLCFTCVTRYVNDRYLFGGVFVLALFAGAAIADVLEASRWRPLARSIAAASCVYALLYAVSIDVMMSLDARHATRRWVAAHSGAETAVALVGGDYMPAVDPPARTVIVNGSVDAVIRAAPDLVVLNARLAGRFERASRPDGRVLLRALEEGTLGYDEVFRYRAPIPAWALLQYEGPMRGAEESLLTNLDKVNPEMVVYRRRRP